MNKKKFNASNIVKAIGILPKNQLYEYINPRTAGKIEIVHIADPEGPIIIKRYDSTKGKTLKNAKEVSISVQMIWRIANALSPYQPINFDRVLGGSYNTRSVLESLLAHTPEFYYCFPGRIEMLSSTTKIQKGHKHLIWCPNEPHELGLIKQTKTDVVISEVPNIDIIYESLALPESKEKTKIDIELQRRHAQIQIALIMIGKQLGSRVWIAQNDKGIRYKGKKLGEMEGVIASLNDIQLLESYGDAIKAAIMIDCIWFKNSRLMPAVFEIEHTTGVTSGLTRMKNFQDTFLPQFKTKWVIVAPDEDRKHVMKEANKIQFKKLETKFFPYSAVEELYSLCHRRKITGVTDEFLDCFMEPCLNAA